MTTHPSKESSWTFQARKTWDWLIEARRQVKLKCYSAAVVYLERQMLADQMTTRQHICKKITRIVRTFQECAKWTYLSSHQAMQRKEHSKSLRKWQITSWVGWIMSKTTTKKVNSIQLFQQLVPPRGCQILRAQMWCWRLQMKCSEMLTTNLRRSLPSIVASRQSLWRQIQLLYNTAPFLPLNSLPTLPHWKHAQWQLDLVPPGSRLCRLRAMSFQGRLNSRCNSQTQQPH